MEVMEEGNLMDKVLILIQRDTEYYNDKQTILQETICAGIVGGRLDFPRSASFASVKLVKWWEDEYEAAYRKGSGFMEKCTKNNEEDNTDDGGVGCGGIVQTSDPTKFVNLIVKSAEQFLEHLHVLTQEALDHADLTVLTGTIGAAALLKNCLWFYLHGMNETKNMNAELMQKMFKKYQEMCEALAERLLDLHCRLLSLYILQDADSLNWSSNKAFCESERGSYVIQMWWLYMLGTKEDLWNTVPPKMAQRVFSGMLNESLTILTTRYVQACPSEARSQLLVVDISNLLLCVVQLLPSICEKADDLLGFQLNHKNKIIRDIHIKCQELLTCLILRGAPLDDLQKVLRKGIENVDLFKSKTTNPMPWITFALPNIFKDTNQKNIFKFSDLKTNQAIALELMVLLAQPQPHWALLLKVLTMKECKILKLILDIGLSHYREKMQKINTKEEHCGNFLCSSDGTCFASDSTSTFTQIHYYSLIAASTFVFLNVGSSKNMSEIFLPLISRSQNWAECFDRRSVWNQIRPPWFEAILDLVKPMLPVITETVINAVKTSASTYQAMLITLACFSQLWDCSNLALAKISPLIQDILPTAVVPLNRSVLIQILISALYTNLLKVTENAQKEVKVKFVDESKSRISKELSNGDIASTIAEALCSIDEDNKHTDQIDEFLEQVRDNLRMFDPWDEDSSRIEGVDQMAEVMVSDILMTTDGKKCLKTLYQFLKNNSEWFFQQLKVSENKEEIIPNKLNSIPRTLLFNMFHIGYRPFDQLLTGEWVPNWINLLKTPMGLTVEKVWGHISLRWDFRDVNSKRLSVHDVQIINNIVMILKQC